MFLDPSASHLIITTTLGDNYYLHMQSRQPKLLTRLKGISIESVGWNPSLPTAQTGEILLGTTDGTIYETYIEPTTEFYRRERRYMAAVYRVSEASAVTGIWVDSVTGTSSAETDHKRILVATHGVLRYFSGRAGSRHGREGGGSIYADMFQRETPMVREAQIGAHDNRAGSAPCMLVISPTISDGPSDEREFAWLSAQGVVHSKVHSSVGENVSRRLFEDARLIPRSAFPESQSVRGGRKLIQDPITAMTLSEWHVLVLVEGRIMAVNRLNDEIVYDQPVLEPRQGTLGLLTDTMKNNSYLFTGQEMYVIDAWDEDRDIWKVFLQQRRFDEAMMYARGAAQKDAVATASGDFLASKGRYVEAATVWGKSSKAFEDVCLTLIDHKEHDALRSYLLAQLATYRRSSTTQRVMVASWLVEVFMSKLNSLDDSLAPHAELLAEGDGVGTNTGDNSIKDQLSTVRGEFQEFVSKYKADLDKKTVYDIIGSHGREEELLFFATTTGDYNFVLSYWIQRERWPEALNILQRQNDPDIYYKHSTVLMAHAATPLVDILMRHAALDPERLIPAMLNYNKTAGMNVSLGQNQAIRYLNFIIASHLKPSAAVHNTLLAIHASSPSRSEAGLLSYLQTQPSSPPPYDADFALRLCIQYERVQSCIHIYSTMGQYVQAVELALKHDDIELAALVADRPEGNDRLRKKLWLLVAEKKIRQQPATTTKDTTTANASTIKTTLTYLRKKCPLLRIEDLIPFFPDFVVIDDFKEEICSALEDYSYQIDQLRKEMDNSSTTATNIQTQISDLNNSRYAIVEPGEKCFICSLPLLSRQFFVFPCQHAFHSDCLGKVVLDGAVGKKKYIRDLQGLLQLNGGGGVGSEKREEIVKELDGIIAEAW